MALIKTARTLVSTAPNGAGATMRGRLNMNLAQGGGFLTIKMTNGASGRTMHLQYPDRSQSHAAARGFSGGGLEDDRILWRRNSIQRRDQVGLPIDPSIMCLEVEFTGNTVQPVTVEAYLSELTMAV